MTIVEPTHLQGLNPEQYRAVKSIDGPLLILAGAGSGKTRVLTRRMAHLLHEGVSPWNILAVTFTNKAATEMRQRVALLVGPDGDKVWVSTFHSSCARILRQEIEALGYTRSYTIYDTDDQDRLLKTIISDFGIDKKVHPPKKFRGQIDTAKNKLQGPDEAAQDEAVGAQFVRVYREYQLRIKAANAVDFNDLINLTVELFQKHPGILEKWQDRFKYIMVDEYQDTNRSQFELIRLLAAKNRNIAVVGDDDQSIYSFRGADIRNILDFEKHYPDSKIVLLEQNYRSSSRILQAATAVVHNNEDRKEKTLWTDAAEGEPLRLIIGADQEHEADSIVREIKKLIRGGKKPEDFALIYRTNATSRPLEQALGRARLPYVLVGARKFYDRREVKDILAYLKLVVNPSDDMSLLRVINVPRRAIGAKSIENLRGLAATDGTTLLKAVIKSGGPRTKGTRGMKEFAELIERWQEQALLVSPSELVRLIAEESGYAETLRLEESEEALGRLQNIEELYRDVATAEMVEETNPLARLQGWLDRVCLSAQADDIPTSGGAITLMTTHLAKGLEYPVVFVVGMIEGSFPHSRSALMEKEIEEERRLAYVAFTRAEERLYLTRPRRKRGYDGQYENASPSRFLREIPSELMAGASSSPENSYQPRKQPNRRPNYGSNYGRGSGSSTMSPNLQTLLDQHEKKFGARPQVEETTTVMDPETAEEFKPGIRVLHPMFGQGEIKSVSGNSSNPKLVIHFRNTGRKTLLARFAKLQIVV